MDKDIKQYIKTEDCRRKTLLNNFDNSTAVSYPQPNHLCCDNCAGKCKCGSSDCGQYTRFPGSVVHENVAGVTTRTRLVTLDQKTTLHKCLTNYHKSLVMNLRKKSNDQVKSLTDPQFLLGFSGVQIDQVLDNCENIFTVQDVLDKVEIWDLKHAHIIIDFMSQVFGDIDEIDNCIFDGDISSIALDCCDTWNGEWDDLLHDDSLFELAVDNLSLSQLNISADMSHEQSGNFELPMAALAALEDYCFPSE